MLELLPSRRLRSGIARRFLPWLMLLALVAQQLGASAHGAMQLRHALAGPVGADYCTTSAVPADRGEVPATPSTPASRQFAEVACGACSMASGSALPLASALSIAPAIAGAIDIFIRPQRSSQAEPRLAHRTRAPPVIA